VTITYVPGIGSLNLEPYRDLAAKFHEENPDIVVDVKMADFLSGPPSLKDMAANSDCFQWFPGFEDPEEREAILSLKPFVDADTSIDLDDYYPQVLEQYMWQGQLMGLPADITPFVFQYNKDLFDAAGQDYPEAGWTWDDFLDIVVAMTQGEGETKQYGYTGEVYELNDLLMITERLGAKFLDQNADPTAFSFDDPDTVEALRWYANLTTEHDVKPVFVTDITKILGASTSYLEREGMIGGGKVAIWPDAPGATAALGDRSELNIGTVSLPARADGDTSGSYLTASGDFISADTDKRQECWAWITFLSGDPAAAQGLPARKSVANSDAYREHAGAERAEAYLASLGDADRPTTFQLFSEEEWLGAAIYWYGQAYGQVVAGEASPEDALDQAQTLADDYRACVIAAEDFGQETWQACAQEVDPTLPGFLFGGGF
jgi:multiple sugar transport system substrate-binding protein